MLILCCRPVTDRCTAALRALPLLMLLLASELQAHHVIGRPVYSTGQGVGSPTQVQIGLPIGAYHIDYRATPAFPQPGQTGSMSLAIRRIDTGKPFTGKVSFEVREDGWFAPQAEIIGEQQAIQGVVRQGFEFSQDGQYIIRARFGSDGQPYSVDFPMQVGNSRSWLPLLLAVMVLLTIVGALRLGRHRRNRAG